MRSGLPQPDLAHQPLESGGSSVAQVETMQFKSGLAHAWVRPLRALRRFDAAEPPSSDLFRLRRERLLRLGSTAMLCLSSFWAAVYLWLDQPGRAMYNVPGIVLALLIGVALKAAWPRIASLLFIVTAMLALALVSLFIDVPTLHVPRSVPLYLTPLAAFTHFLLQHEHWRWRAPFLAVQLLLFVGLAVNPDTYGQPNLLPDSQRFPAAIGTAFCAFALLWWVMHVIVSDVRQRSKLELDFARAVAEGEVGFHLQAQYDARGRATGAEALMRWIHPQRGFISPAEFIPMAERTGLIVPASEHLLREACKLLERWRADPDFAHLVIAVNVSVVQLFEDGQPVRLLDRVPEMRRTGGRLKVELTESVFVQDVDQVRTLLEEFRSAGIRVSLDDFGTGFSSLAYLRKLPLDQLKVDQSFVRDLPDDPGALKIAQTIVHLGRDLNLEVVAEGVETEAQRSTLLAMGCHIFQGYLLARPMPIDAFEAHVRPACSPVSSELRERVG